MKKVIKSSLMIFVASILFCSCMKENHSIRLKNNYSFEVKDVIVGTAQLGNVQPGGTSEYKPINTGNFEVSGHVYNGQELAGSGTLSGKGAHHWTIVLNSSGQVSFAEDK